MAALIVGLGYIGATLAGRVLGRGEDVVAFDNLFSSDRRAVDLLARHDRFRFVEGDVRSEADLARAFEAGTPDVVYLTAAQASADDRSIPAAYTETTNLVGPRLVFEAAARAGVQRVIVASAMRVYGQPLPALVDEGTPFAPQRDLSHLSKVYLEGLAQLYARRTGLTIVPVRLGVVYGLGAIVKTDPRFMTVVNRFCWQACHGESARITPGVGYLPLLHVTDAAESLVCAAEIAASECFPVNCAGEAWTLYDVAEHVARTALQRGRSFSHPPSEVGGPPPVVHSRLTAAGFSPRVTLAEGVHELVDYFLARV